MVCDKVILENICLSIGGNEILKNVSIQSQAGSITTVFGKSGSGKTSLLNVMMGLYVPDSGRYIIDQKEVDFKNERQLGDIRRNIGYFHQELALIENLSLSQNLTIFSEIQNKTFDSNHIKNCVKMLGLDNIIHRNISTLSGGERQRAAFCKLLAFDYPMIMIDEPTNNLDSDNIKYIIQSILAFKDLGKNIIVVSHSEKIAEIADFVYEMEKLNEK